MEDKVLIRFRVKDDPKSTKWRKYYLIDKEEKEYFLYILKDKKNLPFDYGVYKGYVNKSDLAKLYKKEGEDDYFRIESIEGVALIKKEASPIDEELLALFTYEDEEEDPFGE